jgi:Inosine-uridine nucleoside N-ribohydrolase
VQNALFTVEQCGCQTPVYAGCAQPLIRPLETAQSVHGMDGMGDIGLPLHGREPASGHAVDVLIDTIQAYKGEVTLVTLGPLTNLALALLGTELEFVIMVIAVSCVKLLSAHNSTQHTSRKHKV